MVQYDTVVPWDKTLIDIEYVDTENKIIPGLVQRAVKITSGAPVATPKKFIPGATIQNAVDGSQYINQGSTISPSWALMAGSTTSVAPIQFACSDLVTNITTGVNKGYVRAPRAMTITSVRASLLVAQAAGSIFTVDILVNGFSILSTQITIDNGEKTSVTAAIPPIILTPALADDDEITVSVIQVGTALAKGLIVTIIGS